MIEILTSGVALAGQGIARDPSEAVTEEAAEELFRA